LAIQSMATYSKTSHDSGWMESLWASTSFSTKISEHGHGHEHEDTSV
jgi:hypothetical protein